MDVYVCMCDIHISVYLGTWGWVNMYIHKGVGYHSLLLTINQLINHRYEPYTVFTYGFSPSMWLVISIYIYHYIACYLYTMILIHINT